MDVRQRCCFATGTGHKGRNNTCRGNTSGQSSCSGSADSLNPDYGCGGYYTQEEEEDTYLGTSGPEILQEMERTADNDGSCYRRQPRLPSLPEQDPIQPIAVAVVPASPVLDENSWGKRPSTDESMPSQPRGSIPKPQRQSITTAEPPIVLSDTSKPQPPMFALPSPGLYKITTGLTDYWVKLKTESPEEFSLMLSYGQPEFGLPAQLIAIAKPKPKASRGRRTNSRIPNYIIQNMIIENGTNVANVYFPQFTPKMKGSSMLVTFRNNTHEPPFAMSQIPFGTILETEEVGGSRKILGYAEIIKLDNRLCIGILNYFVQFDLLSFVGVKSPVNVTVAETGASLTSDPISVTLEQSEDPAVPLSTVGDGEAGINNLDTLPNPVLEQTVWDLEKNLESYKSAVVEFETKLAENEEEVGRMKSEIESLRQEVSMLRRKGESIVSGETQPTSPNPIPVDSDME